MQFTETPLKGAFLIEIQKIGDERGFFGRSWCHRGNAAGRAGRQDRSDQHLVQPPGRHPAWTALSSCALSGKQDDSLHTRRRSTTSSLIFVRTRPPSAVVRCRTDRGQPPGAVFAQRICPRLSHHVRRQRKSPTSPAIPTRRAKDRGVRFDDPAFGIQWPMPPGGPFRQGPQLAQFPP